jgi:hypothetical protein
MTVKSSDKSYSVVEEQSAPEDLTLWGVIIIAHLRDAVLRQDVAGIYYETTSAALGDILGQRGPAPYRRPG